MLFPSPFRLDGKVALITGSSRGIGFATAKLMAQAGARVVISSRKAEACERVREQFAAEGFEAIAVPCHVANAEQRQRLVQETMQAWGRIDILVSNAGVNPVNTSLQELPPEIWAKVIDTNVTATWRLSQLVLPVIAAQGGGAMVAVSSTASKVGIPDFGAYAVSKAAGNHLVRQLAVEWGARNIRVNAVAPGATRTDMIRALAADREAMAAAISHTALRRIAEAEDVAAAILFLASDAARHVTGQVLMVDGGQTVTGALS